MPSDCSQPFQRLQRRGNWEEICFTLLKGCYQSRPKLLRKEIAVADDSLVPVLIADIQGKEIIEAYYQRCGLETIGPGRIKTGEIFTFSSLEDLFDKLLANDAKTQIAVSHGSSEHGLLIKFAKESKFTATGAVIETLSVLADLAKKGSLAADNERLSNVAQMMGVTVATAQRLLEKINKLRAKKLILHIRGCNIGANVSLLRAYKTALGAAALTAPTVRMVYAGVNPRKPPKGVSMGDLVGDTKPKLPKTRRRLFPWPENSHVGPIIIDIRDIDGHTQLETTAFINDPPLTSHWAAKLNGQWRQAPNAAKSNSFILPVLWDNTETSWHAPLEEGYRQKLVMV